jgi:hypothetical protein
MRAVLLIALLSGLAHAQPSAPIPLEPERTFERTLDAGGTDAFTLDLKTDQIVALKIQDHGKDVLLSIYGPDGRLTRAFSSELQEDDPLQFLAGQSGKWTVKVSSRARDSSVTYIISDIKVTGIRVCVRVPDQTEESAVVWGDSLRDLTGATETLVTIRMLHIQFWLA